MYGVGDRIVHPLHGAGVVREIAEQRINGVKKAYYLLTLPLTDMDVMVPVDAGERVGLRPVMSREDAERILLLFREPAGAYSANWNARYRENLARIKSGKPEGVAEVIRVLSRCEMEKGLSGGERKMLHSAKQILFSELAMALGGTFGGLDGRILRMMAEAEKANR